MYNNLGGKKNTRKKINLLCSKCRNLLSFLRAFVSYCFCIRCGHQSDKNSLFFLLKKEVCIWKYETLSMVVLSSPQTPKGSTALSIAISPSGSARQFLVAVMRHGFRCSFAEGREDKHVTGWSIRTSFEEQEMLFTECKSNGHDGGD